jgi:hypothetical protein
LAIDSSVYRKAGCLRCVFYTKLREDNKHFPLIPYDNSSSRFQDHLVIAHPEIIKDLKPHHLLYFNIIINPVNFKNPSNTPKIRRNVRSLINDNTPVQCLIPAREIKRIEEALKQSEALIKLLGVDRLEFAYSRPSDNDPYTYHFWIDHSAPCVCLYKKCRHRSNRSYFAFNYKTQSITFRCMDDDECCHKPKHPFRFSITDNTSMIAQQADFECLDTLHDRNPLIDWDEEYDLSGSMNPYPIKDLVCIGANMGQGKTVAIEQLLASIYKDDHKNHDTTKVYDELEQAWVEEPCSAAPKAPKCLIITYQRILSRKFFKTFSKFGFDVYLDYTDTTDIFSERLIICLDSLKRVKIQDFDFVFIDEALSVFLHFQSPLIKNIGMVTNKFQHILMLAKHIYLLDANIDNIMIYNTVRHIEDLKNVESYWINNTHIRPTNRKAQVIHNTDAKEAESLKSSAFIKILNDLAAGNRVVVSSSTKAFTIALVQLIIEKFPQTKYAVYNSDTPEDVLSQHADDLDNVWSKLDILIYSPTIGAGLSFTGAHFHSFVAYAENSTFAPSVDLVLQQFFRVRQLIDGDMTIFINDQMKNHTFMTEVEVAEMMDKECESMSNICTSFNINSHLTDICTDVDFDGIKYNKYKLSYDIIKNIIYMKHKSLGSFVDILVNTLKSDYDIPVDYMKFKMTAAAVKTMNVASSTPNPTPIEFSPNLILKDEKYTQMVAALKKNKGALDPFEQQQIWTTHVVKDLYKVNPDQVDIAFYDKFVGQFNSRTNKMNKVDLYYTMQRCDLILKHTKDEIDKIYANELATLVNQDDSNFDLYKSKRPTHYQKIYDTLKLLKYLLPNKPYQVDFPKGKEFLINKNTFFKRLDNYLKDLNENEFNLIQKRYGLKYTIQDMYNHDRASNACVKHILQDCGISMATNFQGKHKDSKKYGERVISISDKYMLLLCKNAPSFIDDSMAGFRPRMRESTYLFFD